MLASSFQHSPFFRSKMRQASATHRINQDVQLAEKKSECGHGQASAYPARSQLGVVSVH
jgi:hypothetical protein